MPTLRQSAGNGVPTTGALATTCRTSLAAPTIAGNLIVVVAISSHEDGYGGTLYGPSGFTTAVYRTEDEITLGVWYRQDSAPLSSVSVLSLGRRSVQMQVLEYEGAAQANALDRVTVSQARSSSPRSGTTATTSQADEVVVGVIGNRYPSTTQGGFTGGFSTLSNTVTPTGAPYDSDDQRSRLTVHHRLPTTTGTFSLSGTLSTARDWIAAVVTFRGGTSGPARMTSLNAPPVLRSAGRGDLTVFGPLRSTLAQPVLSTVGGAGRIGPFEWQFRLGGWSGLLIGFETDYEIVSVDGLGGIDVRTSDGDFPRGDGAYRGADYQSARQVLFTVNFVGNPAELETKMAALAAALTPQRDTDWDLLFRNPGQPLQLLRCRPVQLFREQNHIQSLSITQSFALRAADPRIYSARERVVSIPVSPAGTNIVTVVSAVNAGNARAYPVIRFSNRGDVDVTNIQLVNATANIAFEITAVIPPGGQLVGDMPARVTAAPRSVVQLDGQSRYGSWQPPREPFYLAPDPDTRDGVNALYLRTTPAGADVKATIEYRDTWAG